MGATTTVTKENISVRLQPRVAAALEYLREDGQSKSDIVQAAILTAAQAKRNQELRRQALALRDNPEDVAEMRAIADHFD